MTVCELLEIAASARDQDLSELIRDEVESLAALVLREMVDTECAHADDARQLEQAADALRGVERVFGRLVLKLRSEATRRAAGESSRG